MYYIRVHFDARHIKTLAFMIIMTIHFSSWLGLNVPTYSPKGVDSIKYSSFTRREDLANSNQVNINKTCNNPFTNPKQVFLIPG